jgi:WhiB family redox-sensing transcriptional regulator
VNTSYQGPQIIDFRPSGEQAWAQQAACAEDGVGPMFPHEQDQQGIEYAKSICGRCPVRQDCLSEALDRGERFGVWGGLTSDERQTVRRREQRKTQPSRAAKQVKATAANGSTPIVKRPAIG